MTAKLKVRVVNGSSLQRKRLQFYVEQLVPKHVMSSRLKQFLEEEGFHLFKHSTSNLKGYFCGSGIRVFRSGELGHKNYRKNHSGKRGFFKADCVSIHELMHAVWAWGKLTSGFKQEVFSLHAQARKRYFSYNDARLHPQEWFCDGFPRAMLFPSTCCPRLRKLIRDGYFKGELPDIRLKKGEIPNDPEDKTT